jgi:hypothetical protein
MNLYTYIYTASAVTTSATIESINDSGKGTPNKDTETFIESVVLRDTDSDILDPATIAISMKIALSTANIP